MTVHHMLHVVYALVASVGVGVASAAATHDYSDSWWSPDEPGAGISVQQQADVLFIQLFVYRRDGGPTWFSGAASSTGNHAGGHDLFTGDLYQTTGPYFGTTWNPSAMDFRQVGSLTFDAASVNTATLAYMVDGVPFTKRLNRLTTASENLGGYYYMGWNANCEGMADVLRHSDRLVSESPVGRCDHPADVPNRHSGPAWPDVQWNLQPDRPPGPDRRRDDVWRQRVGAVLRCREVGVWLHREGGRDSSRAGR